MNKIPIRRNWRVIWCMEGDEKKQIVVRVLQSID